MASAADTIDGYAVAACKLAVTSRMARVPLEKQLHPFIGFPVRVETFRLPSKSTRIRFFCGRHRGQRVVVDQSSAAILQASRSLVRRVLGDAALDFIFEQGEGGE